jgi:hypothetical protein
MFFEVLQARVDDLFHPKHFGAEQISDIVDVTICICKTNVDCARKIIPALIEIVQALIIEEYADQHGNRGKSGSSNRHRQLFGSNHSFTSLPDEFPGALPLVVTVENVHDANFLHRNR